MIYREWADQWMRERADEVRPSTLECYRSAMRSHILPLLENLELEEVNEECLQRVINLWCERGKLDGSGALAPKTVRDLMSIVRQSLRAAEQAGVRKPESMALRYPKSGRRQRPDTLSREECAKLYRIFEENPTAHTLGMMLGLGAGLRIGEVCALRWENVHIMRRTIQVRGTLQRLPRRGTVLSLPKTATSEREVPIAPLLYEPLNRMQPKDGTAFVLTGSARPMEPRILRAHFARTLDACGIEHVRFHGLRHTFATMLIESGADCATVSELLGHANVQTTLGFYVHPSMDHKRKCIEFLCDSFKISSI